MATVLLFVCAAVYLNWRYAGDVGKDSAPAGSQNLSGPVGVIQGPLLHVVLSGGLPQQAQGVVPGLLAAETGCVEIAAGRGGALVGQTAVNSGGHARGRVFAFFRDSAAVRVTRRPQEK